MLTESEPLSHGRRASLARAYPAPWRWVAAALVALSRASLPAIAFAMWVRRAEPFPFPTLLAILAAYAALPGAAAWLLARVFTANVEVRAGKLHVRGRGLRLEVPCASIAGVEPWRLPLPGPGVWLRLRSGARLRPGLQATDLEPLVGALAEAGGVAAAREALRDPFAVYAIARQRRPRGLFASPIFKFPGFSLLPTAVLFNAHQHIAYGGTLGQYYLEGLGAWLQTLGFYWAMVCVYLVLYASACRAVAEAIALLAAHAGSARAARARGAVELACGVLYYAGVPALVLARFLL
jgi:apolipoprotein N-acyltransferase